MPPENGWEPWGCSCTVTDMEICLVTLDSYYLLIPCNRFLTFNNPPLTIVGSTGLLTGSILRLKAFRITQTAQKGKVGKVGKIEDV